MSTKQFDHVITEIEFVDARDRSPNLYVSRVLNGENIIVVAGSSNCAERVKARIINDNILSACPHTSLHYIRAGVGPEAFEYTNNDFDVILTKDQFYEAINKHLSTEKIAEACFSETWIIISGEDKDRVDSCISIAKAKCSLLKEDGISYHKLIVGLSYSNCIAATVIPC